MVNSCKLHGFHSCFENSVCFTRFPHQFLNVSHHLSEACKRQMAAIWTDGVTRVSDRVRCWKRDNVLQRKPLRKNDVLKCLEAEMWKVHWFLFHLRTYIYTVSRCCMSGHLRNLCLWFLRWFYCITCQHGRCKSRCQEIVTGFQWMISQAINKYKHRRSGAMIKQCSTREVTPKHHFSAVTISRLRNLLAMLVKRESSPQYFNACSSVPMRTLWSQTMIKFWLLVQSRSSKRVKLSTDVVGHQWQAVQTSAPVDFGLRGDQTAVDFNIFNDLFQVQ